MNKLEEILSYKQKTVAEKKSLFPVKLLERSVYFPTKPVSLKNYLCNKGKSGIIAEFKRKSPSKGTINRYADIEQTTIGYMQTGASALSILTDERFFGGSINDLIKARQLNYCPILQKDFIIDEYQIIEAKSAGADAILLIAAILSKKRLKQLAAFAQSLNLEVLMEVHSIKELDFHNPNIDIVGVNNRNLQTFKTNLANSIEIANSISNQMIKISESAIKTPADIIKLRMLGYNGFLVGERFMQYQHPEIACMSFMKDLVKEECQDTKTFIYET